MYNYHGAKKKIFHYLIVNKHKENANFIDFLAVNPMWKIYR